LALPFPFLASQGRSGWGDWWGGLLLAGVLLAGPTQGQARLNLALERGANHGYPLVLWSTKALPGVALHFDSTVFRQGRSSLRFDLDSAADTPYAHLYTLFSYPVDSVRGHIVTVSGWLRTRGFRGRAGLYAYVHTPHIAGDVGLDRLEKVDSLPAAADWHRVELRLPVKATATAFGLGMRVLGSGHIWFDDLQVSINGRPLADAAQPGTEALLLSPSDMLAPNWDFEQLPPVAARPAAGGFSLKLDSLQPQHGRYALRVMPTTTAPHPPNQTVYLGTLALARLRGQVLTVRGYWRQPDADATPEGPAFAYALLGHDAQASTLVFYLASRHVVLTVPQRPGPAWTLFTLTIPVPDDASLAALSLAVQPRGSAPLLLDNLQFSLAGRPYVPAAPALAAAPTAAESAWLRQHASPLALPDAGSAPMDLSAFGAFVGAARVVGLGEATYGAQDIIRMKNRLVRYLIEQKSFTGVALEAPEPACAALNTYIETGQGDPARLLRPLGIWNTPEVLALVRWLRAHQQPGGRLFLAGIDMQVPEQALEALRRATPPADTFAQAQLNQLATALVALGGPDNAAPSLSQPPDQAANPLLQGVRRLAGELRAGFDTRAKLTGSFGPAGHALATQLHYLRLLEQGATFRSLPPDLADNYRAACLAENVARLAQPDNLAGPAPKIVVWAHNSLIARAAGPQRYAMGQWLAGSLGPSYVALGFAFGQGQYAAEGSADTFYTASAQAAPPGSYEAWFATQPAAFLLDLRRPVLNEANAWLFQQQLFREVGRREQVRNFRPHYLRTEFDGVLYLPTSAAARPL
jgi:erythromycin esterase-like protein